MPGDLPDTVLAAIRVGFRRLSPGAQRALAAASVLGDRVSLDLLARVLDLPKARWRWRSMSWNGTGGWSTTHGGTALWPDW